MGIKKLLNQLDEFFDQSKKKQKKKSKKLSELIVSLKEKKSELKSKIRIESEKSIKSKETYHLCKEFKVLSKMLMKAEKQENAIKNDEL